MAYFVKRAESKALPLMTGTFQQVVKWCLKAQKEHLLEHHHYQILGGERKNDPVDMVCDFFVDDLGEDLV